MNIPSTSFSVGDAVFFRSIYGDFEINELEARIEEFITDSPHFPDGIAICIQFTNPDQGFYLRKTWGRKDEIFPLKPTATAPK